MRVIEGNEKRELTKDKRLRGSAKGQAAVGDHALLDTRQPACDSFSSTSPYTGERAKELERNIAALALVWDFIGDVRIKDGKESEMLVKEGSRFLYNPWGQGGRKKVEYKGSDIYEKTIRSRARKGNGGDIVRTEHCDQRVRYRRVAQARLVEEQRNEGHRVMMSRSLETGLSGGLSNKHENILGWCPN